MLMRLVEATLKPGTLEEFESIYRHKILLVLEKTPGCQYAFLIDNSENEREMLSFTIWSDLEAVDRYEKQGKFNSLLDKVRDTPAELYQWKMVLEN